MQTADKLWRRDEILERLRIDTSTLRRWIKANRWPEPDVRTTVKNQQWRDSTLQARGIRI